MSESVRRWIWPIALLPCFAYMALAATHDLRLGRLLESPPAEVPSKMVYDNHVFFDPAELQIYKLESYIRSYYPWVKHFGDMQNLAVLACASGFFGGFVRHAYQEWFGRSTSRHRPYWLLGALLGIAILLAAALVPKILLEGAFRIRLESLVALSMLAGIFYETAWKFFTRLATQSLPK